jgi:multisubunit Na+/H+ antiporter MnhG subunit
MRIAGLLVLFAAIALFDLPGLWKRRKTKAKELIVYSSILGLALVLCLLQTMRVPMGSPNRLIAAAVDLAKGTLGMQ